MSAKVKFFFTAATGYISGSVLERFYDHPNASTFEITTIVRNPQKAQKFKEFGINAVVGSFSDAKLVQDLTAAADVVVDTADADDIERVRNTLQGFKRKFQDTGKASILIHTTGTGLFADHAGGLRSTDVVWDDANPDQLEQLPPTAPHRDVDLEILQADKEGYVRAYLVSPSTIYGMASGKFVDAGLANKHSIQVPALINAALARGHAGMVGKGLNIWPNVHIDEVADLYVVLYNAIQENPDAVGHGREGYFNALNGEHTLYSVGQEIGRALVALGKSTSEEPTTFTQEELNKYLGGSYIWGSNSRGQANRSRAIGWKPKKTTQDLLASIKPEVEEIIKSKRQTLQRRRILFVFSSAETTLRNRPTGYWLSEAAHPYYVLSPTFDIDFASPKKTSRVEEYSIKAANEENDTRSLSFLTDPVVQAKFKASLSLTEADPANYAAIFYVGGHAPVIDLSSDPNNAKLVEKFWEQDKYVTAVCHGPAALTGARRNGKSIFTGKNATGFSNAEEEVFQGAEDVPFLLESKVNELGGKYEKGANFEPYVVMDGKLITGQNPKSADLLAKKLLEVLL